MALLYVVFKIPPTLRQIPEKSWISLPRPIDTTFFSMGVQSNTLYREDRITGFMLPWQDSLDPGNVQVLSSFVKRVRVLPLLKSKKESKLTSLLFYGPVADLVFDP